MMPAKISLAIFIGVSFLFPIHAWSFSTDDQSLAPGSQVEQTAKTLKSASDYRRRNRVPIPDKKDTVDFAEKLRFFLGESEIPLNEEECMSLASALVKLKHYSDTQEKISKAQHKTMQQQLDKLDLKLLGGDFELDTQLSTRGDQARFVEINFKGQEGRLYFFSNPRGFLQDWENERFADVLQRLFELGSEDREAAGAHLDNKAAPGAWIAFKKRRLPVLDFDVRLVPAQPQLSVSNLRGQTQIQVGETVCYIAVQGIWIEFRIGDSAGYGIRSGTYYSIGRDASNHFVISDDYASRQHCIFMANLMSNGSYDLTVKDLKSTNGTRVIYHFDRHDAQRGRDATISDSDGFTMLGMAAKHSFMGTVTDRKDMLERVNRDVAAFSVAKNSERPGYYTVKTNEIFFDPTISSEVISRYMRILQDLIDGNRSLGRFFSDQRNAREYLDYYALSDIQLLIAHRMHEKGDFENARAFIKKYVLAAFRQKLDLSERNKKLWSKYRKFALMDMRKNHRKGMPRARQLIVAEEVPEKIVIRSEASARDWMDPDVMILDELGYQSKPWRPIPEKEGALYPGEKKVIARWKHRIFFFYVSRSHTLKGFPVHQWRNCDGIYGGWLMKSNPENLDDVPGKLGLMLDEMAYSGKIHFTRDPIVHAQLRAEVNQALLWGRDYPRLSPGDMVMELPKPSPQSFGEAGRQAVFESL